MSASLFSKRHYTWLAKFCGEHNMPVALCIALSDALKATNPAFDHHRFLSAIEFNVSAPQYLETPVYRTVEDAKARLRAGL